MNGQVPTARSALFHYRVGWLLLLLLGAACALPEKRPTGSSEYFQACQERCANEGKDLIGITETATEINCFCGRQLIPESYVWPSLELGAPRYGPPRRWRPRAVGQEYGEPIPSPPSPPNDECHAECGREHCREWLKCGSAYEQGSVMLQRCRDRVSKRHEKCHARCAPGVG